MENYAIRYTKTMLSGPLKFIIPTLLLSACTGANQGYGSGIQHGSYAPCPQAQCLPASQYAHARPQQPTYAQLVSKPSPYGQTTQYQPQGYNNSVWQTPDAFAYGSQVPTYQQTAYAPNNGYYGMPPQSSNGYTYATIGAVHYETQSELFGVQGRLGYQSGNIFGAEVEGSVGLSDDTTQINDIDYTRSVDYSGAAFGLARLDVAEQLSLHGRLGYHATKITTKIDDGTAQTKNSNTDIGPAIGVGGEYALGLRGSIRLDYTHYELDDGSSDSLSLAYARKF